MSVIGPMDPVVQSDTLTVTFGYGALLPEIFLSEDDVRTAVESLGHNVLYVDVDTLAGFRKIIVRMNPAKSSTAGAIGRETADSIRAYFTSVWSVTAEKYELGTGETVFSTQTTVSLAAIAVLVIVGLFLLRGRL